MCFRKFADAALVAVVLAGNAFSQQEDARIPFVVNVNATVSASRGSDVVTMSVVGGVEQIMAIPMGGSVGGSGDIAISVRHGAANRQITAANLRVDSRGTLNLNLPQNDYHNATFSLYSVNGRRVMHTNVNETTRNFSRSNVAPGVYIMSVKGVNGNVFTTRFNHRGGVMNVNVSYGEISNSGLRRDATANLTSGDVWTIRVSAVGYVDSIYALAIVGGNNPRQTITLQMSSGGGNKDCGISDDDKIIFYENFDDASHCFTIINGSQTNQWHVGTATSFSGTRSVYISNNNGRSNTYTGLYGESIVHIYSDITFPASSTPYTLTFRWRAQGQHHGDGFGLSLTQTTETPTAGSVVRSWIYRIGDYYSMGGTTTWNTETITIPAFSSTTTRRLIFSWFNSGRNNLEQQPPAAIDDIVVSIGSSDDNDNGNEIGTQGTFTDSRDGQIYRTVVMPDGKIWMAQNLNYDTPGSIGSYCSNSRLYTWSATNAACPAGWHLPSHAEWMEMIDAVQPGCTSGPGAQYCNTAATKLKSTSSLWGRYCDKSICYADEIIYCAGTNDFGFSALPCVMNDNTFENSGSCRVNSERWWTSTSGGQSLGQPTVRTVGINILNQGMSITGGSFIGADTRRSIRCVKSD